MNIFDEETLKQLKQEDKKIDELPLSEIDSDLTDEQKKIGKQMRSSGRKIFNINGSQRAKKVNEDKQDIIRGLRKWLDNSGFVNIKIVNDERELTFADSDSGVVYKLVLSVPRKKD